MAVLPCSFEVVNQGHSQWPELDDTCTVIKKMIKVERKVKGSCYQRCDTPLSENLSFNENKTILIPAKHKSVIVC